MTAQWLGQCWQQVRRELDKAQSPYTVQSTCAPGKEPCGEDIRVVQVKEQKGVLHFTVCAFQTRVKD